MIYDDSVSTADWKRGYAADAQGHYVCLHCGHKTHPGEIYRQEDRFYDARLAMTRHITQAHGSAFDALVARGKKATGLTDVQGNMMRCFHRGLPDKAIAAQTGTSASTVRYQRFMLREKAKQARVFIALFELMEECAQDGDMPPVHAGATMVDERYMVSCDEEQGILRAAFTSLAPLRLGAFPARQKKKIVVLRRIAREFELGNRYSELQMNDILKPIYGDCATIRRYLIEYGFMSRTNDGSEYWLNEHEGANGNVR